MVRWHYSIQQVYHSSEYIKDSVSVIFFFSFFKLLESEDDSLSGEGSEDDDRDDNGDDNGDDTDIEKFGDLDDGSSLSESIPSEEEPLMDSESIASDTEIEAEDDVAGKRYV